MPSRLELYPFRFRDPVTRKRVRARYLAERHEIAQRYTEWEIIGPPEIRDVDPNACRFNPNTGPALNRASAAGLPAVESETSAEVLHAIAGNPAPFDEDPRSLDDLERFLLLVFLRRYITHCARSRRFAAMNGAARLFAEVGR